MRVEILGPVRACADDGTPVALRGRRPRTLLVLLALEAGRIVTTERLIDGLYGEDPPEGAANALQSQVSRLRRALGAQELVEFHPSGYRLAARAEDVDAHRFERLAAEGRQALHRGEHERAAGLLREGLALWRGPALSDAPHERPAATRLAELRLTATEDRVAAELALGGHHELVTELRELTAAHPLRERLRAQLMRALYAGGRQADALAAYEEGRRLLDEELGVEPGPELASAHLSVVRAEPAPTAPKTMPAPLTRRGLRAQLTSFVGRSEDLDRVGALLTEARLVTLIGPGGAGKTRLAQEAAERRPGEVCFVALAPVVDGADVAQAVLGALDVRDTLLFAGPDRHVADPTSRLVAALSGRELLLVLDNCEHLVGATADLTDLLLASCPALRVLVTSREALGITGETMYPLAPLALPPTGLTAQEAQANPAVRLFADRARAVLPAFAVDQGNVEHVIRICRALDGLPLAIELAAARLRGLPVAEVAARLDDRFQLLARGSRTALPRHQTLRAVVAWSWDLLDESERTLARRLTVFVGGVTLATAEKVCGVGDDVLVSLAEKSLIELVDGRYLMLETIRAFCAERLAEAGEVAALREAHAAHYLELATEADPHLRGAEQLEWLAILDAEHEDLHAAVRWAVDEGQGAFGLRLLAALTCYWWLRGQRAARAGLAAELVEVVGPEPAADLEEEYLMALLLAASADAVPLGLATRLAVRPSLPPYGTTLYRHDFLTMMMSMYSGPPDDDDAVVLALVEIQEWAGLTPWMRALSRVGGAFILQNRGELSRAELEFERSLGSFRSIGERWGMTLALSGMSEIAYAHGDFQRGIDLAEEALELAGQLGSVTDIAEFTCRRADCLVASGDLVGAHADYSLAAEQSRRAGSGESMARAFLGLGEVAWHEGDLALARSHLEQALAHCPTDWYSVGDVRDRILAGFDLLGEDHRSADGR